MMRDSRINRIFEGSSEIMHLFMAREAVDRHLQVAGALVDPATTTARKLAALPRIAGFYARWYPSRWLGWGRWPRYGEFGALAPHLHFAERAARRLARAVFHGMARYRGRMQVKQAFLFRAVDVGNELFAMAAAVSRAQRLADARDADAAHARELADLFCRSARRRVRALFRALWHNDDARKVRVARHVLAGEHEWLERGIMGIPFTAEELVPPQVHHGGGEEHAAVG
jgi:alkylation response protein AidB-like acyl-CoA dehydrogenase